MSLLFAVSSCLPTTPRWGVWIWKKSGRRSWEISQAGKLNYYHIKLRDSNILKGLVGEALENMNFCDRIWLSSERENMSSRSQKSNIPLTTGHPDSERQHIKDHSGGWQISLRGDDHVEMQPEVIGGCMGKAAFLAQLPQPPLDSPCRQTGN